MFAVVFKTRRRRYVRATRHLARSAHILTDYQAIVEFLDKSPFTDANDRIPSIQVQGGGKQNVAGEPNEVNKTRPEGMRVKVRRMVLSH